MNRVRLRGAVIAFVLAVAACAEITGASAWQCDVTLSMDNRTASGSGSGSTQQEALDEALSTACARLGLAGAALSRCEAGGNPGAASWSSNYDCETT
ncbi:MAG: hypothetical protein F4X11_10395 [Acidobacteria bacterium]|nr:hypothetical protein [Gemmatimonadota bacterium]MYJ18467.1 hypothetical protein [Gemmatimonadota bacterium]MYN65423.1 hypothetical protein [Acidobacteriota bacterium]